MTGSSRTVAVLACAISLWTPPSIATTVVPPTFEEMVDKADLIFVGQVVRSRAEWRVAGNKRAIFTLVEFETQEVLKGTAGASVTLQFLGGTVGDVTLEVAGGPTFNTTDRVIVCVEGNGVQFCPIVGVFHGKFSVRKNEKTGRDIVFLHDGRPLRDIAEVGSGDGAEFGPQRAPLSIPPDREPMTLDGFKTKVRERLLKGPGQR
jgi:hypothetical protein